MNRKPSTDDIQRLLEQKEGYHPLRGKAFSLDKLIEIFQSTGEALPAIAQEEERKRTAEYLDGIRSHALGLGVAGTVGNADHCSYKHQSQDYWGDGAGSVGGNAGQAIRLDETRPTQLLKSDLRRKTNIIGGSGANGAGVGSNRTQIYRQLGNRATNDTTYKIVTLNGNAAGYNNRSAYDNYIRGKLGDKSVSIGQRSIFFSANGTPIMGSDALYRRGTLSQFGAGNAVASEPITTIPTNIKKSQPINATKIGNKSTKVPVANAGDTVGNVAKLGLIAAAVTGVMLAVQYIVQIIAFIINISTLMATVSNIYRSVLMMVDNVMEIFGVKDASKPATEWLDGLLSNVFGKENAAYIKYNFARVVNTFQAVGNLSDLTTQALDSIAEGVDDTNSNVGKIGNAMKRAGLISQRIRDFQEQISTAASKGSFALLNRKLQKTANVSNDLEDMTEELKSLKEKNERNDKILTEELKKIKAEEQRQKQNSTADNRPVPDYTQADL